MDQIDTVQCSFDAKPIEGVTKLYTYKAKRGVYQAGDLAIIDNDGKYKFVVVVSVDEVPNIDPSAAYDYKWLVQKLDTTGYKRALAAEETLMQHLRNAERTKLLAQVKEECLGVLPEVTRTAINAISITTEDEEVTP